MARPNIIRGQFVSILVQTAAGPPAVFTPLCGLVTRSLTDAVNTDDQFVRDCALPDEVPWREIIATGRQFSIAGAGQLNRDQFDLLETLVGALKNYRFMIAPKTGEVTPAVNGWYAGEAMVTNKRITGDDGALTGVDLAIESNGPWAWVDAP